MIITKTMSHPQVYGALNVQRIKNVQENHSSAYQVPTLLAHLSPHALHNVLGPVGPRRIIGVDFELIPQCVQLCRKLNNDKS